MGKLLLEFCGLIGCAAGFIGGICVCCLCGDYWPLAIGVAILGFAAFPRVRGWWNDLNGARKAALKNE